MTEKEEKELENEEVKNNSSKNEEESEKIEETDVAEEETEITEEENSNADIVKELNDKYLRLFAEFDNFKKRTQKEKIQIYTTAAADVIEAILPLIDNLKRALNVETTEDSNSVIEGIKLIERQFDDTLMKLGVEEIKSVGKEFDPMLHNAVMHVDDESIEGSNIIVEEFAKGYKYRDVVIRHSTVKVAN